MGGTWLRELLAGAWPGRCCVCGAWPAATLCTACIARFAPARTRCVHCALPLAGGATVCGACLREAPPLDACHAAVDYAYPWDGLVTRFKFQAQPGLGRVLAPLLRETGGARLLARADLVLPMPLAPQRLRERGYNQALLLARALSSRVDPCLLLRVRETAPQLALDRAARERNVRGAFAVEPVRAAALRGRRVLLVDDVMTSGASLHAAADSLRAAGAGWVGALVFARTPMQ